MSLGLVKVAATAVAAFAVAASAAFVDAMAHDKQDIEFGGQLGKEFNQFVNRAYGIEETPAAAENTARPAPAHAPKLGL